MKQKTKKTVSKRFRVSAKGKLLRRKGGQDHFNSREPGKVKRNKRRDETMSDSYKKSIKMLMNV
ncbi:50S ribosomal protein L35 [Patescibacteria group bacterium]|nr:50S ribosomal protein L35 [Patescibacteria group bacterium]MDL1953330.1 50S ribosomal protein L35 [Candidatus Uhrbacteria bacterium UHB]RIL00558.1 MAG: 50S ribosomal protein L35 [Candidatus Uhrbacteria bacterium]